jgi:hypothetical protein
MKHQIKQTGQIRLKASSTNIKGAEAVVNVE